jgi:hypothetical protein
MQELGIPMGTNFAPVLTDLFITGGIYSKPYK